MDSCFERKWWKSDRYSTYFIGLVLATFPSAVLPIAGVKWRVYRTPADGFPPEAEAFSSSVGVGLDRKGFI